MTVDKFIYCVFITIIKIWSISISPESSFVPFVVNLLPSQLQAALICSVSLEIVLLYSVSQALPFLSGFFQHTFLRPIHVVVCINTSFIFLTGLYFSARMHHSPFIQSPVDGCLACLHLFCCTSRCYAQHILFKFLNSILFHLESNFSFLLCLPESPLWSGFCLPVWPHWPRPSSSLAPFSSSKKSELPRRQPCPHHNPAGSKPAEHNWLPAWDVH